MKSPGASRPSLANRNIGPPTSSAGARSRVLLLLNYQNDFFSGGARPLLSSDVALRAVNALRRRRAFSHVVLCARAHAPHHGSFSGCNPGAHLGDAVALLPGRASRVVNPDHCVLGSWGAKFHPALTLEEADILFFFDSDPDTDVRESFSCMCTDLTLCRVQPRGAKLRLVLQ